MSPSPPWLTLLAALPADEGECRCAPLTGEPFAGWEEIRLVLGDGRTGLRVVVALYDPAGRPGMVSDLVATAGGHRQESLGARVEPHGGMQGTYWLTEGDRHTPRPLTDAERSGLRALAGALRERCSAGGAA